MIKHQDKQRKQDLGIFYTPQEVVNFIFEILNIWKKNQATRWKTIEGKQKYPSVIDPAVGEGGFLKVAIEKNFTKPDWIFGLDIDENAVKRWKEINLLKDFGGNEKNLEAHFFHQNGLDRIHWEQHTNKYRYKLKQEDIHNQQFDVVVGNPPYGGLGIYDEMILLSQAITGSEKIQKINTQVLDDLFGGQEVKQFKQTVTLHKKISLPEQRILELKSLSKALLGFEVWKDDKLRINRLNHTVSIDGITFNLKDVLDVKEIERLKSFPIEILFLERFIQLAKSGGWIAIVIPDGILTNYNSDYVRKFISRKTKIEAVVSLPRNTFKNAGTNAKTSILFLRKLKPNENLERDYPVFLSSLESLSDYNFQKIVDAYQKFYNYMKNKNMDKSQLVQIAKDQTGKEAVMVRVDKTLKEMMDEKPQSRLDVKYWHPKYDYIANLRFKNKQLKEYLVNKVVISADTIRASRGESYSKQKDVDHSYRYYSVEGIWNTGYNANHKEYGSRNAYKRLMRSELQEYDVAIARSGTGSLGKCFLFIGLESPNMVSDLYIVRCNRKLINPFYILVLLKTKLGEDQIQRNEKGVSGQTKLTVDMIENFVVPDLNNNVQHHIEVEYQKIATYHNEAIGGKRRGNDEDCKKNLEIAEKMLKDLIARTETVIRGEREDIV